MQTVLRHHGFGHADVRSQWLRFCDPVRLANGEPTAPQRNCRKSCANCVAFVERADAVARNPTRFAACRVWLCPSSVICEITSFGNGLLPVAPALQIDVPSAHGADLINGLALHTGASVVEVLPIYGRQYRPCEVFAQVFSAEKRVFSFHLDSSDRRFSVEMSEQSSPYDWAPRPRRLNTAMVGDAADARDDRRPRAR